jgi:hypothetical protein
MLSEESIRAKRPGAYAAILAATGFGIVARFARNRGRVRFAPAPPASSFP